MEDEDCVKEEFKWPAELTRKFIHIRLQHEWLFQKRKQSWNTLHAVLMDNGFPKAISVDNVRKKWSNLFEDYKKALHTKYYKWPYFNIFHGYLGNSNSMEAYPNWTNEWLEKFIDVKSQNDAFFDGDRKNEFDGWNIVEYRLRAMGLPIDCSVRKIEEMWNALLKTFKARCRLNADGKLKYPWPLFDSMKKYHDINKIPYEYIPKKDRKFSKKCQDSDSESDNERLIDVKRNLTKLADSKEFGKTEEDKSSAVKQDDMKPEDEKDFEENEFKWSQEWTECFLHLRLQNDNLFKQKRNSWKRLHEILLENGFPDTVTVDVIRKKWNSTFEEYQKAVTLKNVKWLYYDIFHSYLGDTNNLDMFKNWTDDWVKKLIQFKMKHTCANRGKKIDDDVMWNMIEADLRKANIPSDCSVRNIHALWAQLIKSFRVNHKCVVKKNAVITWPFYNEMRVYYEKCDPKIIKSKKVPEPKNNTESDTDIDSGMPLPDIKDDDSIPDCKDEETRDAGVAVKKELLYATCRTCMGMSDVMLPLFKSEGMNLSEKLMTLTAVHIAPDDSYPQCICQSCADELNSAYYFKIKCEETEVLLKTSWHKTGDVKKIKEEVPAMDVEDCDDARDDDIPGDDSFGGDQGNSDTELIDTKLMSRPYDIVIKTKKRNPKKIKPSSKKKPNKIKMKKGRSTSKNLVLIPSVEKSSGAPVMRKRYVYYKVCDICGKATQRMTEHMRGHIEEKTLKCPKCPKMFRYSAGLQTHIKTHAETPLKVCQLCGREFYRNLTYKRHLVYHANERKFECETCGKTFNTSDILRVHMRSHTGERPFSCKICGKAFLSSGCVSRHQKVHRKLAQAQPPPPPEKEEL